jgi:hypothetical protein
MLGWAEGKIEWFTKLANATSRPIIAAGGIK